MAVKNPGYPQGTPGFSHNNQNVRERLKERLYILFFPLNGNFNFAPLCLALRPSTEGAEQTAWSKLTKLKYIVKIWRCRLLTHEFTFFSIFFVNVLLIQFFVVCLHYQTKTTKNNQR
jgi:hypothetical protein